jgi:NADH-quinone oxidoreductase subunit N
MSINGAMYSENLLQPVYSSYHVQSYFGIILYLFLSFTLCVILAAAAYLFSLSSVQDSEKRSEYECGFEPFDSATRLPFDVHFYLVGILFLIFDVEIALLFPWVLSLRVSGWFGYYLMMAFITLLAVGFLYEWKRGALIWPSRQQELTYTAGLEKAQSFTGLVTLSAFYKLFAAVLFNANTKTATTEREYKVTVTPQSVSNQLRILNQLPREVRKARLSSRLKQLNRILGACRFSALEDYIKAVRFMERNLVLLKARIGFYIRKTSQLVTLCQSKNFHSNDVVAYAEQEVFAELRSPVKGYTAALNHYKELHMKLTANVDLIKKEEAKSVKRQNLLKAVQTYLLACSKNLSRLGKEAFCDKLIPIQNQITRLTNKSRLTLRRRRQARRFVSVAAVPATCDFASITETVSYAGQFFGAFLPEMVLTICITSLLVLLAVGLGAGQSKKELTHESLLAFRYALAYTGALYFLQLLTSTSDITVLFSGYAWTSTYVVFFKLLTVIASYFILTASKSYISEHRRHIVEYPLVLTLATLFLLLLIGSGHLISAFLALVGFSLNLYVLVLFDAITVVAREAGIKYFYLSILSSGLMIYSIFLFLLTLGTGNLIEIAQYLPTDLELSATGDNVLHLAVVFLLIGLFFKLAAFPGHLWAAEVYEGSPDPITGFFMLPVKIAVLGFVMHLLAVTLASAVAIWQPIVMISASVSMIWGCLAAVAEPKTKRFMAYTSINQMGFLLLGLATASTEGYRSTLVYLLIYIVMNIGFLVVFLSARRTADGASFRYLTDFRELGQQDAVTSWMFALVLFSMAGIPPLAGFFGKYYLLLHAQEQGLYGLVIIGLATSLLSTYYYLRLIKIMWFEGSEGLAVISFSPTREQYQTFLGVAIFLVGFLFFGSAATDLTGNVLGSLGSLAVLVGTN